MIIMSEEEYIDFKKEFEDFKKELENSRPIFDDDSIEFNDFDNLISDSEDSHDLKDLFDYNSINSNNSNNSYTNNNEYPNITLETDDILLNLIIKKDYSKIEDLGERKKEFFNDLRKFIDEFESTEESNQLMKYYEE